jgi:ABC-type phosphate/phosphonate transport system ATPase subunit
LLSTLAEEQQLTLGVSLHDQRLARAFLPRLVGVRHGKIFKDAPAQDWTDTDFEELYHLDQSDLVES